MSHLPCIYLYWTSVISMHKTYSKENHMKIIGHAKVISAWNLQKFKDIPASDKNYWSLWKKECRRFQYIYEQENQWKLSSCLWLFLSILSSIFSFTWLKSYFPLKNIAENFGSLKQQFTVFKLHYQNFFQGQNFLILEETEMSSYDALKLK